jgi:acyl CoA:acetate/3-ketoacid CoA transferase beta subunit
VDLIVTDLAVFDVARPGLTLVDLAPGVSVEDVRSATAAPFKVHPAVSPRAA